MSQFKYETLDPKSTGEFLSLLKTTLASIPCDGLSHLEMSWALAYLASEHSLDVEPAGRALCIAELVIDALKSSINDQGKKRRPDDQITLWPSRGTTKSLFPLTAVK